MRPGLTRTATAPATGVLTRRICSTWAAWRKRMPITYWTFLIGGLALGGFPFVTAGFWSKDDILAGALDERSRWSFWGAGPGRAADRLLHHAPDQR